VGIMAKDKGGSGDFTPPPTGLHNALCVDVIDLGENESPFRDDQGRTRIVHQIQIVWQLHNEDEDGEPLTRNDGKSFRISKFYTLSLNEKANLRKDLDSWRGVPFTEEELSDGFDVEKLIGVQCKLNLITKKNQKGEDRVVVASIARPSKRDPQITVEKGFAREMNVPGGRDMRSPPKGADAGGAVPDLDAGDLDEALPF
jgi:hypothetical protein